MAHNKAVNTVYASYFSRYCGGLHPQPEQVTSASLETNPLATCLLSNDLTSQTATRPTLISLAILATCLFSNQIQDLSSNQPYYVPHNLATVLLSNHTPDKGASGATELISNQAYISLNLVSKLLS